MSLNRLVTKDINWPSSLCPCAGVVVEPLEPAAALPVVVADTALVELAGVLTGTVEGAALAELGGFEVEIAAGAGLGELAGALPDIGAVTGPGELAGGLLGTVAGVVPTDPVAAPPAAGAVVVWLLLLFPSWSWPFLPVRNWSTTLAMSWNKVAKKVKIWLSSFCPCC
jgi:hypothetical protein